MPWVVMRCCTKYSVSVVLYTLCFAGRRNYPNQSIDRKSNEVVSRNGRYSTAMPFSHFMRSSTGTCHFSVFRLVVVSLFFIIYGILIINNRRNLYFFQRTVAPYDYCQINLRFGTALCCLS